MRRIKVTRKKMMAVMTMGFLSLAGMWIFSSGIVYFSAQGRTFDSVDDLPKHKAALVLGCSKALSDGQLNLFFEYRVEAAAKVYHAGKVDYIIVSGDNSRKGYDEPSDMKAALVERGVPEARIYCDYAGFRTLDSVVRCKAIFDQQAFIMVSQRFHNERAIFLARQHGLEVVGFNAREVRKYFSFKTRVREQLARIKAVMDVYLLRTQPKFLGKTVPLGKTQVNITPSLD